MVNLTSFVYFVVVQMVMISSKPVIHFSHAQFLPFVIRQDTGSIFMSNIKCSTVTTRRKMYHLRYHLSNFSWLHQVVCWESKASNKLTHHSLQLSRLLLLIALLIWKSCIYRVIFMTFPITFCLHDNWSQKWVKLILCLVTCCVCENEVMHITAMTCIHIVETKYHINVQKHFLDNIPQILFFLNIILIFHMSFPNWICGKLKCTIIRYFRHSHLCENLHLQFFNPFKKMWWILTGVYQCQWIFSHEDWICALSDHKRQILGMRKMDHCFQWNHHQLHNNFSSEKLYES